MRCGHTHVCMYACMHACMYACMYECMHACMHVYMYVYNIHTYIHTSLYMCVYVYTIPFAPQNQWNPLQDSLLARIFMRTHLCLTIYGGFQSMGVPSNHDLLDFSWGIFHEINHPALGDFPMTLGGDFIQIPWLWWRLDREILRESPKNVWRAYQNIAMKNQHQHSQPYIMSQHSQPPSYVWL